MGTTTTSDFDRTAVQSLDCLEVGRQLGLTVGHDGMVLCPVHNEKTPSCMLYDGRTKSGFFCFACRAHGDAIDLVRAVNGCSFPEALAFLGITTEPPGHRSRRQRRSLQKPSEATRAVSAPKPKPKPYRPPTHKAEMVAFWRSCRPIDADEMALSWLESRGLDWVRIVDGDLLRALPDELMPTWAFGDGHPWNAPRRCVVPVYGSDGHVCGVRGRLVEDEDEEKELSPKDGLGSTWCLANDLGRLLLRDDLTADDRTEVAELVVDVGVIVTEGVPDWLSWATLFSDGDDMAPAVFGYASGSWGPEIADKVPDGATVTLALQPGDAGHRMAREIKASFGLRPVHKRWVLPNLRPKDDWNYLLQAEGPTGLRAALQRTQPC